MKTQLLLPILFCALLIGCKTTTQSFATPQYPRNAQLQHGYYGETMYVHQAGDKQTACAACDHNSMATTASEKRVVAVKSAPAPLIISALGPVVCSE